VDHHNSNGQARGATCPYIMSRGDSMPLTAGNKLGPYEIVGQLGAGGMGEVEPFCGREPERSEGGSLQAKSRAKRGISC
jgi:hypothetical protein